MVRKSNRRKNPIYQEISENIKEKILSGELRPGEQLPVIKVLGKQYQVSVVTASRAINHLKERGYVRTTWGGGCYVADRASSKKVESIATIAVSKDYRYRRDISVEAYWDQIFSQTVLGVQEQCAREKIKNQNILVPQPMLDDEKELLQYLRQQMMDVDGVICVWQGIRKEYAQKFARSIEKPLVFNDLTVGRLSEFNGIQIDVYDLASKIMEHLVNRGHQHIACIAGGAEEQTGYIRRMQAYRAVLGKNKLPCEYVYCAEDNHDSIVSVCKSFLNEFQGRGITAVFCFNDYRALALKHIADERGIEIPDDLAIAGFDGTRQAVEQGITTIQLPFYQVGRESVLLLEAIVEEKLRPPVMKAIRTGIIHGRTTQQE